MSWQAWKEFLIQRKTWACLNGHWYYYMSGQMMTRLAQEFCPKCGAEIIWKCPECQHPIDGTGYKLPNGTIDVALPNYCSRCGTAHPWRQRALAAAVEALQMELDENDAEQATTLVPDIASETPRTEVAVLKIKKLLSKLPKATYDVVIKIIADIASAKAKHYLGMAP